MKQKSGQARVNAADLLVESVIRISRSCIYNHYVAIETAIYEYKSLQVRIHTPYNWILSLPSMGLGLVRPAEVGAGSTSDRVVGDGACLAVGHGHALPGASFIHLVIDEDYGSFIRSYFRHGEFKI